MISIIIPVYNEEKYINKVLESLVANSGLEIIVVDGQSLDRTVEFAQKYPVQVVHSIRNRSIQLNEGIKVALGDIFLFLHADCLLEEGSLMTIKNCLNNGFVGGCLSQEIDSDRVIYRLIEASGNIRAKLFKIFYGDQAIFVRRDIFLKIGGFDRMDLFEDIIFSKKLKREGKSTVLNKKVYVSARRWQKHGIIKTTFIYWLLSLGFLLGISTNTLKRIYRDVR